MTSRMMHSPPMMHYPALFLLALLPFAAGQAQPVPFGLDGMNVAALAAERSDHQPGGSGFIPDLRVFAGGENGVVAIPAAAGAPLWEAAGLSDRSIAALCVQHWGVGPRDGIHLFAAIRDPSRTAEKQLLFRKDLAYQLPADTVWTRADSGMKQSDTAYVQAVAAWYYTGHTPPQRVLAACGSDIFTGSAGATFWTRALQLPSIVAAIDVHPRWFGTLAWAAGYPVAPTAFKSTDQGDTWTRVILPAMIENDAWSVVINPRQPDSVWVGAGGNTLFFTGDGGASWTSVVLPGIGAVRALAIDPQEPQRIFAGGAVLYMSEDGGAHWRTLDPVAPLRMERITSLLFVDADSLLPRSRRNYLLYIGTQGSGVWRYRSDAGTGYEHEDAPPAGCSLQVYPDPSTERATILVWIPETCEARLDVFDLLGRHCAQVYGGLLSGGTHCFPLAGLPIGAGSYMLRLSLGGIVLTRRMHRIASP